MPLAMDKSKKVLRYQRNLPLLIEVQWNLSDLPYVVNKDIQN